MTRLPAAEHPIARVVILRQSRSEGDYNTRIRDDYAEWLRAHVHEVVGNDEAGPLLTRIVAREGVDSGGKVFVTTFHFGSAEALQAYDGPIAQRMRGLIEKEFPGAIEKKGFRYGIINLPTASLDEHLKLEGITGVNVIAEARGRAAGAPAALREPHRR